MLDRILNKIYGVSDLNQLDQISLQGDDATCFNDAIDLMNKKTKESLKIAEEKLMELSKKYPECVDFKHKLGLIYLQREDYENAIKEFNFIFSEKGKGLKSCTGKTREEFEARSLENIGTVYFSKKNYQEAEKYYTKCINKIKDNDELLKKLGAMVFSDKGAALSKLGKYAEAQDQYEQASNLDQKDGYLKFNIGNLYYERGLMDKARESFQSALTLFEEILKQESNADKKNSLELAKAKTLINVGRIELIEGNFDSAEVSLKLAEDIYNSKESVLKELPQINQSQENENINSLHNNLGILYLNRESFEEAKKEFRKALKAKPDSAQTYNNLANVYAKQNNKEMAEKLYKTALRFNSKLCSAKRNLELLNEAPAMSWWNWWFSKTDAKAGIGALIVIFIFLLTGSILVQQWVVEDYFINNTSSTIMTSLDSSPSETSLNKTKIEKVETIQNRVNATNTTSAETTLTTPTSVKTITITDSQKKVPASPEIKLLFVALLVFLLIHPQVRGFSAGTVKFDLQLQSEIKGAKMENEFDNESRGSVIVMDQRSNS